VSPSDPPSLSDGAKWFTEMFHVSRETRKALEIYEALLIKWQKTINLVGPSTVDLFWERHAADSAQLLDLVPVTSKTWLDIGSGGGFPGLVIAMLWLGASGAGAAGGDENAGRHVHLIESDQRKCAFMRAVIRETGAPATVHEGRIEAFIDEKTAFFGRIDVVSARALAPLPKLVGMAAPFFESHTKGVFLKGKEWQEELTQARQSWKIDCMAVESRTDKAARVLLCECPHPHQL
jgi:16S rRNA (guanine527-N7)-methyltransferase